MLGLLVAFSVHAPHALYMSVLTRPSSPRPLPVAARPQSYLVRFNKAATLDGEVNLELPPIQEVEVEVSVMLSCACRRCDWRGGARGKA